MCHVDPLALAPAGVRNRCGTVVVFLLRSICIITQIVPTRTIRRAMRFSLLRLAAVYHRSPRSETEFYVGNRFFALCTSSVSKILRAGTFCPYSVCLSVRGL